MLNRRQPVRVYWNYKHRCYSIFQNGSVCASARAVHLENVIFKVRESGRQRMIRENRKIIHAYAIGHLVDFIHPSDTRQLEPFSGASVFYNPYQHASFVHRDTLFPIHESQEVRFDESGTTVGSIERIAA